MSRVFSGIQPTGSLHLGNFLGAVKLWMELVQKNPEDTYFFSLVDLHAFTVFQEPSQLREAVLQNFALYMACGLKPSKNLHIFQQSAVKEHAELAWLLSCHTPMGWLDRMTQYKDKTAENKERACLGLYSYPVLMAADILLYDTNTVPVGEDQVQHIELARDIAERMNRIYKENLFVTPQFSLNETRRVMSLKDGTKKMSKSEESDFSRINLTDSPDLIAKKIAKATTGTVDSPEVRNLFAIYKGVTGRDYKYDGELRFSSLKTELTEALIAILEPIQGEFFKLMKDTKFLQEKLARCSAEVGKVAAAKMAYIKGKIGF